MLNSINTNTGAMSALRNLNATAAELMVVRQRISSGLKVASARDNGAVWAIAQNQRSDVRAFDAILNSLNRGSTATDVALTAGETVADLLAQMKVKALAAADTTLDAESRAALNTEFTRLRDQITVAVKASEFDGVNLLKAGATDKEFLAGLQLITIGGGGGNGGGNGNAGGNGNGNGNAGGNGNGAGGAPRTTPTRLTVRAEVLALGGPNVTVTAGTSFTTATSAASALALVEQSLGRVTLAVSRLGSAAARFNAQIRFVSVLQGALEAGVGGLVDADLARESARLQALQTRQLLGVESLSIANRAPGVLLQLFAR